jgi:threonine synthase
LLTHHRNDILHRFWTTGRYEKHPAEEKNDENAKADVCKETPSPAMDILVSSNFERLLWFLVKEHAEASGKNDAAAAKQASEQVVAWYNSLKATGGFGPVSNDILENGRRTFESDRVSNEQTLETIKSVYRKTKYVLDPHTAVGITVSQRSVARAANATIPHISLSTAHPAKFADVVKEALKDEAGFDFDTQVLPDELKALSTKETRVIDVENSWEAVREIVKRQTLEDLEAQEHASS